MTTIDYPPEFVTEPARLGLTLFRVPPISVQITVPERKGAMPVLSNGMVIASLGYDLSEVLIDVVDKAENAKQVYRDLKREFARARDYPLTYVGPIIGNCYVVPLGIRQMTQQRGMCFYTIHLLHLASAEVAETRRGIQYLNNLLGNDFNQTAGRIVTPLSAGAGSVSETVDYNRTILRDYNDASAGTVTVPCVEAPTLQRIHFLLSKDSETGLEDANLNFGNIEVEYGTDGRMRVRNGCMGIRTRNGQSNPGAIDIEYFSNNNWVQSGVLELSVGNTAHNVDELYSLTADMFPLIRTKNFILLQLTYPSTTTNNLDAGFLIFMWRGKPYIKTVAYSAGIPLGELRARIIPGGYNPHPNASSFTAWSNRADAGSSYADLIVSGSYGPLASTGSVWYSYIATTDGAQMAAGSEYVGFASMFKASSFWWSYDTGTYWREFAVVYSGYSYTKGNEFPAVWFFAGRYADVGSVRPSGIALELLQETYTGDTLMRITGF